MVANRYAELPAHTRDFIESLSEDDLESLKKGIKLAQSAETVGRFWKWTFILAVSAFAGLATIGQSVQWLLKYVRGE